MERTIAGWPSTSIGLEWQWRLTPFEWAKPSSPRQRLMLASGSAIIEPASAGNVDQRDTGRLLSVADGEFGLVAILEREPISTTGGKSNLGSRSRPCDFASGGFA